MVGARWDQVNRDTAKARSQQQGWGERQSEVKEEAHASATADALTLCHQAMHGV
jgi:hypothetical protein